MISWDACRPFSKDDCSFQSKTLCKKRLPKQPQFEWQGTIAAGTWFQRKQTCRNPNYVLVMKVWFWLTNEKGECAVLFTAPKMVKDWVAFYHHGCRDAGTPCMNMLCLKSCTAHTGFSAKIEVEMGHESHVSRSFYGFMVRDKGHCLLAFRYEHGSANGKQSNTIIAAQYHAAQLLESLRRHTVPMQ